MIRARAVLVRARTTLVNAARGLTKSYGERLRRCGTQQVGIGIGKRAEHRSSGRRGATVGGSRSAQRAHRGPTTGRSSKWPRKHYPEVARLQQVKGVGTLIALDIRADSGRSASFPAKPGRGVLYRPTTGAQKLGQE